MQKTGKKIELGSIENLKKIISNGDIIYKRGVDFMSEKTALVKKAQVLNDDASSLLTGGQKLINDFISSAKDLGVDTKNIKEVQEATNILGLLNTVQKQTQSFK